MNKVQKHNLFNTNIPSSESYKHYLKLWLVLVQYLREIGWKGVDRMHLAQDRDQWQALVNMIMNIQLP